MRKTKTYALVITLAFNIVLIIELLRFPLVGFIGDIILGTLQFIFKYSAIISLSKFYISRSGDMMKKCEKKKIQRRLTTAIVIAFTILATIIGFMMYRFIQIQIDNIKHNTDAYLDLAFHKCHFKTTVISHAFWMASNLVLLGLGYKLKSIVGEKTEEYLSER